MSAPVFPLPFNTPPITAAAAQAAAAGGGGKRKSLRDRSIANLARKSRRMAGEFREAMEKSVKKKLDSMSGPDDNRKRGLKVAQFIPGKGLEVGGVQEHNDASIYCSLGIKGDKLENALEKTFDVMKGKKISMDFAYKLICKPQLGSKEKNSRVTAINCFRHVNPDSYNYKKTGTYISPSDDAQVAANKNWHTTLGPDSSYIRRGSAGLTTNGSLAGTWRGTDSTNVGGLAQHYDGTAWQVDVGTSSLANSLYSPYRYPHDMEVMYSRINRQVMENYGFSLNSWRFRSTMGSLTGVFPSSTNMTQWVQPGKELMNFPETANTDDVRLKSSFPAYINTENIHVKTGEDVLSSSDQLLEYVSQFGPGKLNYQFSNDGTNPVCIDICVVGVKKGQFAPIALLQSIFGYNYNLAKYENNHRVNVAGYQAPPQPLPMGSGNDDIDFDFGTEEWHSDAKLPFIPNDCFKNPASFLRAADFFKGYASNQPLYRDIVNNLEQGKVNPFKLIKRDQFIVSSGSTRAWNTTLPSIKYRPNKFEGDAQYPFTPFVSSAAELELDRFVATGDEYTFVLLVGASGMSKPMEELYPAQTVDQDGNIRTPEILKSTISDHEPSSCNVSVVGTYTETCMPAYPQEVSDRTFINGRLSLPYFTVESASDKIDPSHISHHEYPDRLSTVDIATQMQVVRTTDSGITGVGAINTEVGA